MEIKPHNHHPVHTQRINPNLKEAEEFDKWARANLEVIEVEDPNREEQYTNSSSDKLFGAEGQDWFEDEFLSETYLKIKHSTPISPSILVIIPKFRKVLMMLVRDVPARLRMYERHIVFLDKELSTEELRHRYFDKLDDSLGRDLFALMKVVHISNPNEVRLFLQLWSGQNL